MENVVLTVHLLLALALIGVVLIQKWLLKCKMKLSKHAKKKTV